MKSKLPKPKKQKTLSQLKKLAWSVFSLYIRIRDCDLYQKGGMVAPCYTCGSVTHYSKLQAGHFLQGRGNSILFDEEGVHAQDIHCNIFLRGNPDEYWPRMLKEYGADKVNEMLKRKHTVKNYTREDYENIIDKYKKKLKAYGDY